MKILFLSFVCIALHLQTDAGRDFSVLHQRCLEKTNERLLVTGAAGFIGYHACKSLARRYTVVGIDNFNSYYPVSLKLSREAELMKQSIPVVHADVNDYNMLSLMFNVCAFTHVLHLAAQPGVRYALKHPFAYVSSNIQATVTLLEVIRKRETVPVFVYASSSSVYGLSRRIPFSEYDRADVPASLYAATKRSQELITHSYFNCYGVSATGLRFFTVYGPWGRPDMAVMAFTRSLLTNKEIRVFVGPGNKTLSRDFTYIDDIVNGIESSLAYTPKSGANAAHKVINLGNSRVVDVYDLIRLLERETGKQARLQFIRRPFSGEVLLTNADITLASSVLAYKPQVDLSEGVPMFLDWYYDYFRKNVTHDMKKYIPE